MKTQKIRLLLVFISVGIAIGFTANLLEFYSSFLRWPAYLSLDASQLRLESVLFGLGKLPYLDFYSFNLPGTHWTNLLLLHIFGTSDFGIRLSELIWILVCAGLLCLFLYRSSGFVPAFVGGFLFLTLPEEAAPYGSFQRETIFLLPLFLLWNVLLPQKGEANPTQDGYLRLFRRLPIIVALSVFSAMIKPFFLLFPIILLGERYYSFLKQFRKSGQGVPSLSRKEHLSIVIACVVGVSVLLFLFWPILASGKTTLIFDALASNIRSHNQLLPMPSWESSVLSLFSFSGSDFLIPLSNARSGKFGGYFLIVFFLFIFTKKYRDSHLLLPSLFAGLLTYWIQIRGFHYYLIPTWVILQCMAAVLVGSAYSTFIKYLSDKESTRTTNAFFSIFLFGGILFCNFKKQNLSLQLYKGNGLVGPRLAQGWQPFRLYEELDRIVPELRSETKRISYVALDSATFSLAAILRYNLEFDSYFTLDYGLWADSSQKEEFRKKFLSEMDRFQFDLIVIAEDPINKRDLVKKDRWPEFSDRLKLNYDSISAFSDVTGVAFEIFRKKRKVL
ncbi:dolichyl-phosphate-mannose-protein mannosyltransferase [Leptospira fainei serovar Hurstbridge str. BUT 6]|uniref:Dolichyl-phosphate-mannose-protein mannosyltransferase n=1 Tax=Leptospira fainei serovar Hurstbridge str. BUT 6 TaxID=1193011 RepID=S3W6G7_9LEPT|nr:dolichyl-phosphate-mannose--protein mannosyltransferase [Leptospira fainei]EPG75732.1 dolichyl-phosphate-mannose-protein mannosyltransferase [Leptospira fainei serovar Hurstbridge str. BUT 6]